MKNLPRRPSPRLFSLVSLAALLVTTPAGAVTVSLCDFSNVGALQVNGDAGQLGTAPAPIALQLAPNDNHKHGSAFWKAPVPFPAGTSFHTFFKAQMAPNAAGADGMSFTLQNSGAGALGSDGSGLGYSGISPSVTVEFDTYQNTGDPNANHVALTQNGNEQAHLAFGTPSFALSGSTFYAWIDYDGAAKQITAFVSTAGVKPNVPMFTHAIDIASILGGKAFVGFTGATGGTTNSQRVLEWEFSTDGLPCGCEGAGACSGGSCATSQICAACATDADCGSSHCDPVAHACVGCLTNTNCGPSAPVCDPTSRSCVGCLASFGCLPTAPVCDPGTLTCGPCRTTADCSQGLCATTGAKAGECVGCLADSACKAPVPRCNLTTDSCVQCLSAADCSGRTPICGPLGLCVACASDLSCGGTTPACATTGPLAGGCEQCSATNVTRCQTGKICDPTSNTCTGCASNQACPVVAPVCTVSAGTCGPCKVNADCTGSASGGVCVTAGPKQGQCVACLDDTTCAAPSPVCDTIGNACVGCLTSAGCAAPTPVCNPASSACVGCVDDSACGGATPACDGASQKCVACTADYDGATPPGPGTCPSATLPACQPSGALAGTCAACSASNQKACGGATPVCAAGTGTCGCNADSDCGANRHCDKTMAATGTCEANGGTGAAASGTATAASASASASGSGGGATDGGQGGGHGGAAQGGAGRGGSAGATGNGAVVGGGWGCSAAGGGTKGQEGGAAWVAALGCLAAAARARRGANARA